MDDMLQMQANELGVSVLRPVRPTWPGSAPGCGPTPGRSLRPGHRTPWWNRVATGPSPTRPTVAGGRASNGPGGGART